MKSRKVNRNIGENATERFSILKFPRPHRKQLANDWKKFEQSYIFSPESAINAKENPTRYQITSIIQKTDLVIPLI